MAGIYHINGDSVSPCKATKGNCPYAKGEENNHFADAGEAMAVLEYRLAKEYSEVNTGVKKTADSGHDLNRGVAAARGMDTTEYDKRVAAGEDPATVAAEATPTPSAKDLAASGADAKTVRDALRAENPSWSSRQVHTVQQAMTKGANQAAPTRSSSPAPANNEKSPAWVKGRLADIEAVKQEQKDIAALTQKLHQEEKAYNALHGAAEGRAYYYDYRQGTGRVAGVNPDGNTFFDDRPEFKAKREELAKRRAAAYKKEEDLQTEIEESGNGHRIPDEGNTIRVRTQAQKWLLKDELQGQISDGQWENSGPQDHWQDWSNAKVIVDPSNVGRNFRPRKDNYQLNAKSLLDVVGDRMVENVQQKTGHSFYNDKAMYEDLKDLRKIFKTAR